MRTSLCELALIVLAACHAAADESRPTPGSSPHVRIIESSASATDEFTSAAILSDTTALTWSEDKPSLTLVDGRGSSRVPVSFTLIGVGPGDRDGVTAFLDRTGQVLFFDGTGAPSHVGSIALDAPPHVAIRTHGDWFVIVDQPDGPVLLRSMSDSGSAAWRMKLPLPARVLKASGGRIRLLPTERGVVVLSSLLPFDVLTYSQSGKLTHQLRLADVAVIQRVLFPSDGTTSANWRLVAGVRLGDLDLLTLSDLNSDRRVLLLVDPDHGVLSIRETTAPLAALAANRRWILAGRRTNQFELVRYQWGWVHSLEEER